MVTVTTVQQINRNEISIRCHYAYRGRCRSIPGAEFDESRKAWVVPVSSIWAVLAEFPGEIYFKTPLWKILGEQAPPKKNYECLGPVPDLPRLMLKPYDYQAEGIRFMIDRLNNVGFCLNGDSVGLGKTLMAVGTLKWFVENRGARKILIICKKSIKGQWASEIRRIAGWEVAPIFVTGSTKAKRVKAYKGIEEAPNGILITNYHNFLHDSEEINRVNYDICVVDEAHSIKGREGKMNELIGSTISGKRTILLTGTPIMSRPDDIYGIVKMVAPKYFDSYEEFKKRYLHVEFGIYGEQIIGAKNLDELQDRIRLFLIMRSAEDVALELPKIKVKRVGCSMDYLQLRMQGVVEDLKAKLNQEKEDLLRTQGLTEQTKADIEAMNDKEKQYLATLQFIADDPAVFRYKKESKGINAYFRKMLPDSYKMSAKTETAVDLIDEIVSAGEKVIVFCHWASSARMLRDHFEKINGAGVVMYTGAESDEIRERNREAFLNDPDTNILIGTEAMAEGLNLQVCPYLINYEQADTYAQREQRIGRIRRIGSKYESVNIIDLVSESPNVKSRDDVKLTKLERDKLISDSLLKDNGNDKQH